MLLVQQELLKIRNRWTEVDNGGDNSLNHDQFLEFRHPEIAGRSYKYIVDNLIGQMGLFVLKNFSIIHILFLL